MNFALLNKIKASKNDANKEFDIVAYLNKTNRLSKYIDIYFMSNPIQLLDSLDDIDKAVELVTDDPPFTIAEMFKENNNGIQGT